MQPPLATKLLLQHALDSEPQSKAVRKNSQSPRVVKTVPQASGHSVFDHSTQVRLLQQLQKRFDNSCIIEALRAATGGDFYIFGGTLRRALCERGQYGDLDVMVPNGDFRAFESFEVLRVPFEFNRQGHHRYRWNGQQIDAFQPREFYKGFADVEGALRYFDLKINALAFHVGSGRIVDPFQVSRATPPRDPGINWPRWNEMPVVELCVLLIRLVRIMHETPALTISRRDAERLRDAVISKVSAADWEPIHDRFPPGKKAFLELFERKVLSQAKDVSP